MATLFQPPNFFSYLSPHHNNISAFRNPFLAHQHLAPRPRQHFTICCSTIRKSRASRKLMSDADLCNELKEFISLFGFEDGHVPSMKELSHHGRKDLAHIVRRRGYKLIGELLGNSRERDSEESDVQRNLVERQSATVNCENGITGQDEKAENSDEILSSLVTDSNGGSTNVEPAIKAIEQSSMYGDVESPALTDLTLQEKVEKFIQNGELDMLEDESGPDIFRGNLKLDNNVLDPENFDEHLDYVSDGINDAVSSATLPAMKSNSLGDELLSTEPLSNAADCEKDLDVENDERENQAEINHLKLMLHQKEVELSQLKEQIEKEKLALSALQVKAESAIRKAQKLVSEKDEELQAAEESLLGLKEVQIQYLADGEVVEVAGSFNGWHQRVKLDAQPDSSIVKPIGSRISRVWSAILWLYPGEYEIKFVVDGEWKTDPHRESITRGTIHNNILRVDR